MRTAIVILNWNTKDYLRKFLPGLIDSVNELDAEVIVADNASSDGSIEMLAEEYPGLRLIRFDSNLGFTGGYNAALESIDAEYYLLLNSDIEVKAGWLEPLVGWMDSHPECGACGPKLLSYFDHGSFEYAGAAGGLIDRMGFPFCRGRVLKRVERDNGQYDAATKVLWVSGASLLLRSTVWKELGGLDGRFFAHMEEIDLCWRMQTRGWEVWVVPQSEVYHLGGGTLPASSPWKLELNYRNNLLLLENNLANTFACRGLEPERAIKKAKRRIFLRKLLDGLTGLVYLLELKPSYTAAVWKAHRGYHRLRRKIDLDEVRSCYTQRNGIHGLYGGYVISAAMLKGKRIFGWLRPRIEGI